MIKMVTEQATAHPPEDELSRYACDLKIGRLVQAGVGPLTSLSLIIV